MGFEKDRHGVGGLYILQSASVLALTRASPDDSVFTVAPVGPRLKAVD